MDAEQLTGIIIAALGAGSIGALFTYLMARRRTSGQIGTTDADRLWTQNDKLIDTLRHETTDLRERLTISEHRVFVVEQDNRECNSRADRLETRLIAAEGLLTVRTEAAAAQVRAAEERTANIEKTHEIGELKRAQNGG